MSNNIQGQSSAMANTSEMPLASSRRSDDVPSNVTIGSRLDQVVQNTSAGIATMTITETDAAAATTTATNEDEVIPLNLRARGNVTW